MKVKAIMTKPSGYTEYFAVVDPKEIKKAQRKVLARIKKRVTIP